MLSQSNERNYAFKLKRSYLSGVKNAVSIKFMEFCALFQSTGDPESPTGHTSGIRSSQRDDSRSGSFTHKHPLYEIRTRYVKIH